MPDDTLYNETELFSLIAEGDETAFEQLYNLYLPRLYPVIFSIVKSELLVKDIIQEVFLYLWMDREKLMDVTLPRHWIFKITYNRAYSWAKKQATRNQVDLGIQLQYEGTPARNTTEESVVFTETARIVKRAILDLPSRSREIYTLSREYGLKPTEIATQLGMSPQVVKNSLLRSGKLIKTQLIKKGIVLPLLLIIGQL